jgi:hypothetical protein
MVPFRKEVSRVRRKEMSSTYNTQDANASTQQQVQGSIQVQDSLPTVFPQNERNTIVFQFTSKRPHGKLITSLLICIALILIAVGAIVWVLSITDAIQGPWSSICIALFTSVGTLIPLLHLYFQHTSRGERGMTAQITVYPGKVTTTD